MTDPMRRIIEQFPEKIDVIRQLRQTNSKFENLCQEYGIVNDRLDALTQAQSTVAPATASALRKRRIALEEEILMRIEGYSPV
jgi:uncharacterized protein YdcH (DUF465 family)